MPMDYDHPPDRLTSESFKWRKYDPAVLPLWVADMDFPAPAPVREALRARVDHGVFGYPVALPPVREAIVDWLRRRYDWLVEPDSIVFLPGVVVGFNLACSMQSPGSGVLVQTPVYPPMLAAPASAGLSRQSMELTRASEGSYSVDWDAFEAAITPDTRLFLLCNPHNPVSRVFTRAELERMAEICLSKGVLICSDEIHADLVFAGHRHIPIASLSPEVARRTITVLAPSKTFNIAGLNSAFAIIPDPELRKTYQAAGRGLVAWANVFGLTATLAAYREGEPWLAETLAYLQANRDTLAEYVRSELPGLKMTWPEGTHLAWLDCRGEGLGADPSAFFLEHARVALNAGPTFGQGGDGFVRLNFACSRSLLTEALDRMKRALADRPRIAGAA